MNAPAQIDARRNAEQFAVQKISFSAPEYLALSERYADAVAALQIAIEAKNFAGVRSAYLSLYDVQNQTEFLNLGLFHAISDAQGESHQ